MALNMAASLISYRLLWVLTARLERLMADAAFTEGAQRARTSGWKASIAIIALEGGIAVDLT